MNIRSIYIRISLAVIFSLSSSCGQLDKQEDLRKLQQSDPQNSNEGLGVVNGHQPSVQTQKHTVGIRTTRGTSCSGTIVSSDLVISAKHCFQSENETIELVFGNTINSSVRRVSAAISLPGTNEISADIALIKFTGGLPAGFEPVPIINPTTRLRTNQIVRIAGFGISNTSSGFSGRLLEGYSYLKFKQGFNHTLALGGINGQNLCNGDSGGPTFISDNSEFVLIGVTSYGQTGCNGNAYVVDLRDLKNWIVSKTVEMGSLVPRFQGDSVSPAPTTNISDASITPTNSQVSESSVIPNRKAKTPRERSRVRGKVYPRSRPQTPGK